MNVATGNDRSARSFPHGCGCCSCDAPTEGGRISSILWWDHCTKKQLRESVGSGGYKDPDNDEFIYAETQLYKEGLETYTLDEIKEYINQERKTGFQYGDKYKSHDLIPSFNLAD